jgi:hypothetical protein
VTSGDGLDFAQQYPAVSKYVYVEAPVRTIILILCCRWHNALSERPSVKKIHADQAAAKSH